MSLNKPKAGSQDSSLANQLAGEKDDGLYCLLDIINVPLTSKLCFNYHWRNIFDFRKRPGIKKNSPHKFLRAAYAAPGGTFIYSSLYKDTEEIFFREFRSAAQAPAMMNVLKILPLRYASRPYMYLQIWHNDVS